MDPPSDLLRVVRLNGAFFFEVEVAEPWSVVGQPPMRYLAPMAHELAAGKPVTGVTCKLVYEMNAAHAEEHDGVSSETALDMLRRNSTAAAAAIRTLSDEQLDRAAEVSLNRDAPLTCQFMLEDHAVRHSYHHLAVMRAAVNARLSAAWKVDGAGMEARQEGCLDVVTSRGGTR